VLIVAESKKRAVRPVFLPPPKASARQVSFPVRVVSGDDLQVVISGLRRIFGAATRNLLCN
jgi:hypothetical protein